MWILDHVFWILYLVAGLPIAILFDRALDVRGEWIWQTVARLRKEHKRLYPKGKP
jgi:hypothetical protein